MSFYIAADVGGTQLRAACYPPDSLKPIKLARTATKAGQEEATTVSTLERLQRLIASVWPENEKVHVVCVTAPGPINPYEGIVLEAPNIPEWVNLPLGKKLEKYFDAPVVIGNDANLAALGEWKFGAGQGHHDLIYITISTGIGGGIIIDDHLILGKDGLGGEIGHMTVLPDGPVCGCGHRGHLEAVASGTAIAKWVEDEISQGTPSRISSERPITAKAVSEAANKGDKLCIAALNRAGYYLGQALADLLHIFNPSMVIIGGGVSQSGNLLFEPMHASLREHIMAPGYLEGLTITKAVLGDEVGLIGALALGRTLYPPNQGE